jgi:hypothetical protein
VRGIAMHVAETIRGTAVTHEDCHLMGALGREAPEVPSCCGVGEVGSGIFLLGVDEVGEF